MTERIKQLIDLTNDVHVPIPIDESETAEARLLKKRVLESRLIDDMETLDNFTPVTEWIKLELTRERCICGEHSLKITSPTNLTGWDTERGHGPGRIYDIPSAYRKIDNEDWSDWNRLSIWIYPDCPGMKSMPCRIQLHNDGEHKVPDRFDREGGHNYNMKQGCWNHIVLEIPYVARDKVVGVSIDYDMVGHEPEAVDHITWYVDKLELQKVKCDVYEGWIPAEDRICYSNSGYQPGGSKIAIASDADADSFKLIELATGKVVLQKAVTTNKNRFGELKILDFSEITDEGSYIIVMGELTTRAFRIANDVWEDSVWKLLNFYLVLRCGYDVYGKHRACHTDMLLKHNGKAIVANGGWHDAGDLAQGMNNTIEATQALLSLARALKDTNNDRLYRRVLEEAKWGMDYVIKMRFGDGYRAAYSSCSIWTDGIIGTDDDVTSIPARSAYTNFDAAYALGLGAEMFEDEDRDYARFALKIAKEDYAFGMEILEEIGEKKLNTGVDGMFERGDYIDAQVLSIATLAECVLYRLTKRECYREQAREHGCIITKCQQREYTDWDVPMIGFYYENTSKHLIWHHNHMSYAYLPDLAMSELIKTFPDSDLFMLWYSALVLSGKYYQAIAQYTAPYGVIPSGIYHENEAIDYINEVATNHPMFEADAKDIITEGYGRMVQKGVPLGKGYYLRVYPVWFSFRGNYNVLLSDGKAAATVAAATNNLALYDISQKQFQWIVGKNPTAQSTLYGEGYDYIQLYAVQPGQTVGAISVGMQSNGDNDEPFWPQVNNATYKEVWVCSATKWMWSMENNLLPATVSGCLARGWDPFITFKHSSGKVFRAAVDGRSGWFEITLPVGAYEVCYGGVTRNMAIVGGKQYSLYGELFNLTATHSNESGRVTIELKLIGEHIINYTVIGYNLTNIKCDGIIQANGTAVITAMVENLREPFIASIVPCGNWDSRVDIIPE